MNLSKRLFPWSLAALLIALALPLSSCAAPHDAARGAAAPSTQMTGVVRAPDGKPAAGAKVIYERRDLATKKSGPLQTTETNAQGEFSFDAPIWSSRQVTTLYAASPAGVAVSTPGTNYARITLAPFTQVHVRFVDADGKPVPNVSVVPSVFIGGHTIIVAWRKSISDIWTTVTDANGGVTISHLPQGFTMMLYVEDERYAHQMTPIALAKSAKSLDQTIHLVLGGSITGAVSDKATGKPAAGVFVSALRPPGDYGESVPADKNGQYKMARLAPGKYAIALYLANDKAANSIPRKAQADVKAGQQTVGPNFIILPQAHSEKQDAE